MFLFACQSVTTVRLRHNSRENVEIAAKTTARLQECSNLKFAKILCAFKNNWRLQTQW